MRATAPRQQAATRTPCFSRSTSLTGAPADEVGACPALQVLLVSGRHAVDIGRCSPGPMHPSRYTTDQRIFNAMAVQDFPFAIRIEGGVRRGGVHSVVYPVRGRSRFARNFRTLSTESSSSPASVVGRSAEVGGSLPTRSRALSQCLVDTDSFTFMMPPRHLTPRASLATPSVVEATGGVARSPTPYPWAPSSTSQSRTTTLYGRPADTALRVPHQLR